MRIIGSCRGVILLAVILAWVNAAAAAGENGHRDLVRVRQDKPWLRINAGGHTATVQALAFTPEGSRLCSAGLDKTVQVWNLQAAGRDLRRVFLRHRVIRWQVARGLRGSIYALATAPSDGLLAIGGYGAMGRLGEILLVDPARGSLKKVLQGHRQTIRCLAFSADGNWLASMDVAGEARLWKRDGWQPIVLYKPDREHFGPQKARPIEKQPKFRPILIVGNTHVILPYFVGKASDTRPRWKLVQIGLQNRRDFKVLDTVHHGMVTALAVSRDGTRMASADLDGNLYVWDLRANAPRLVKRFRPGSFVLSLCFSPDGRTLVAGTAVDPARGKGQLLLWDLGTYALKRNRSRSLPDHVQACAVSPDGRRLAYTGGENNAVFVEPMGAAGEAIPLRGSGRRVLKVAFAKEKPFYRVAFGTKLEYHGFNDYGDLQKSFDTTRLALAAAAAVRPADWLSADWLAGAWTAKPRPDGTLQLYRNNVPKGTVALEGQLPELDEGAARCYCWLPDPQGRPFAVVVGTNLQNSIYVCRLVERGPCPILRHFRGHHDQVTSVGISRDLRYVVSGSFDGTVRFWSLSGYAQGKAPSGRWGAEFAVQGDRLVATRVHPAGPLSGKGVRDGDVLRGIRWFAHANEEAAEKRPAAILQKLGELPWGTQVAFDYTRGGAPQKPFQLLPAWQPLATLFVSTQREWAFWAPSGYYDASVNGYRLFGWQVNRGLLSLPDFYRADQFYNKLERPDVMSRLLSAGSLQDAFRLAALKPGKLHEALPEQIAATPQVSILSPAPDTLVRENSTKVRARIEVPANRKLVRAKVFANGVVAPGAELVNQRDVEGGKELTYEWNVPLPKDERNLIQVIVGTDAPTAAFGDVIIKRPAQLRGGRLPRLFILAIGVNQYGDPKIRSLAYSVADAQAVVEVLKNRSRQLYTLDEATLLTDKKVTPETWKKALGELTNKLKNAAKPDDLLIFFLAGHGVVDNRTRKYYFVGHDLKLEDYKKGVYSACISWDDFRLLAEVPCRKLALLDTCHSGAIQPPRSRDLKRAVRQLQEDVIFTVTASTGEQLSAEKAQWRHGAFTKCLLEALSGRADGSRDGIVTLDEVVNYVKRSVPELTGGGQTPTAAPDEILPFTSLPLTRVP